MMIAPEAFYETELKGKTTAEISACIRRLKRQIGRERKRAEKNSEPFVLPSPDTVIACCNDYLQAAYRALAEAEKAEKKEEERS